MAVTGTSQHPLSQEQTFYGLTAPVVPGNPNAVPTTGSIWIVTPVAIVVAGAPGVIRPASEIPADLAAIRAEGALGQLTPWTPGQYVVLGDASETYWDGTQWQNGRAPNGIAAAVAGAPGSFTDLLGATVPTGDPLIPADLASINALGALGNTVTPWTGGDYVVLGDNSEAYWSGNSWLVGRTPLPVATTVVSGAPGTFGPVGTRPPTNKIELDAIPGGPAWTTTGNHVTVGGIDYYWDGAAWVTGRVPAPLATTVTAGTPGTFGPATSRPPATKAELDTINGGAVWTTTGQYVTVGGQDYYWTGGVWQSGRVPAPAPATGATPGAPGTFTGGSPPSSLAELQTLGALGQTTMWSNGQYVGWGNMQGANTAYWDGAQWVAGPSPAWTSITPRAGAGQASAQPVNVASGAPDLASLQAWGALGNTGQPTWPAGGFIRLRDGSDAYWTGTAWTAGVSPGPVTYPVQASQGVPGSFGPPSATIPPDLATLVTLGRLTNTLGQAWTQPGAHVVLGDSSEAHWDGATWVAGRVYAPPPVGLPGAQTTIAAGAWNNGNPGPASTTDAPDVVVMQDPGAGNNLLYVAWNQIADPTKYQAGTAEVQVLDQTKQNVLWSTRNTAGNRVGGLAVPGYVYGTTPVRIVMHYNDGTTFIVDVTP